MAEEFQAGICGGNWWNINNPSRGVFPLSSSSLCSLAANTDGGNYSTWQTDNLVDLKLPIRSREGLFSDNSLGFLDEQKPKQSESSSASENGSILMDSTLQMMGLCLPSSSTTSSNWNNQSLFGRPESNFHSVLEEEACIDSSNSEMIQKDWSPKSQVSSINDAFKPINQEFSLDQQGLNSASYGGYLYDEQSPLHPHPQPLPLPQPQAQDSLFTNPSMAHSYNSSNDLSPTWSKASPFLKPSMPKQQLTGFHFSNNNTPFWNNSSSQALDDVRADVFASPPQSQTFEQKPNCSTLITKHKREEAPPSEPAFKRPRFETPSPLPTFKVRKEKLGDRITALQQLVSPFGKTDTASVLHEAIEYIKYLHDQVSVLSAPYLNNGAPIQHQQGCDEKELKGAKQDLRSQGLCLVPISSTFPVANYEITAELWTPTYGGALTR